MGQQNFCKEIMEIFVKQNLLKVAIYEGFNFTHVLIQKTIALIQSTYQATSV